MVPFVALLALSHRKVSVEEAVAAGAKILAAFDVAGPYRLLDHREVVDKGSTSELVRVWTPDRRKYAIDVLAETGRCRSVTYEAGLVPGERKTPDPNERIPADRQALVERGLARLGLLDDLLWSWSYVSPYREILIYRFGFAGHSFFAPPEDAFVMVRLDRRLRSLHWVPPRRLPSRARPYTAATLTRASGRGGEALPRRSFGTVLPARRSQG